MSSIAIVSDSTAALPDEFAQRHGVVVVPLYVQMGSESLRDGVDLTPETFYERLPHCATLPTTSQPSTGDLANAYRKLIDEGATGIVSIHISSGISGTINSARLASGEVPGVPIEIVDVRCAAASHQITVEAALYARKKGGSFQDVVAAAHQAVEAQRTVFMVDTLEYLHKGGRIGGASAFLGSVLQFKPLLHFVDGQIAALSRVRGTKRAYVKMGEVMSDWVGHERVQVLIMQANAVEGAKQLLDQLQGQLNIADARIVPLTPVIGAHIGPGTIGLCCCPVSVCGRVADLA